MRATINESTSTEGSRKLYAGAFNMHIKAINPTMAELKAMGINVTEEQNYFIIDDKEVDPSKKVKGIKVRVMLENKFKDDTVNASLTFYLRKEFIESSKDPNNKKYNYIDQFGNTSFLTEADVQMKNVSQDWIDKDSLKKAVKGEAELVDFLKQYFNPKQGEPVYFEAADLKQIFAGNLNEVKKLVNQATAKGNAVRVLLLPREKDGSLIQYVYDRKFDRAWSSTSKYIHKNLMENLERLPAGVFTNLIGVNYSERDFFMREVDPTTLVSVAPVAAPQGSMVDVAAAASAIPGLGGGQSVDTIFSQNDDDLPF